MRTLMTFRSSCAISRLDYVSDNNHSDDTAVRDRLPTLLVAGQGC